VSKGYEQIEFMERDHYFPVILAVAVFQVFLKKIEISLSLFGAHQNQWLLSSCQWFFKLSEVIWQ